MIFSQVILTAFVIYWLSGRVKQEKLELRKDLLFDFQQSEQKMLDTLIMDKMIHPVLRWKRPPASGVTIDTVITATHSNTLKKAPVIQKRISMFTYHDSVKGDSNYNDRKRILETMLMVDSGDQTKQVKFRNNLKNIDHEKLLLQGVKMFVNIVNDSLSDSTYHISAYPSGLDTSVLKNQFNKKLHANNFQAIWVSRADSDSLKINKSLFFLTSDLLNGKVGVKVQNYTGYILRKLAPNMAFGLILLLLTGAAFVISHKSLKKQLMLNKIRDEFVSNISHELKTPVSTVKISLEALKNFNVKDDPVRSFEYIQIASQEMDRLDSLIQKVLTSSVYNESSELMSFEMINLDDLIADVIRTSQPRFLKEEATIITELAAHDALIWADRLHIQGVIVNLLDNSLKYTTGKASIIIKTSTTEANVILAITDNGAGIPEEFQSKVFDKFFRVPADNKHNVKGYGLGLSYVAMVVKHHGGTISVKNNEIAGCTFTLSFPKK